MFRRFSILVVLTITFGVTLTLASVYAINELNWKRYSTSFYDYKNQQMNSYIDNMTNNMEAAIESHAYWTDALTKIEEQDDDWLYDNATGYIIDMELFDTDYILVTNEDMTYIHEPIGSLAEQILANPAIDEVITENRLTKFYMVIEGVHTFVVASPVLDNEQENPSGMYLCAAYLDEHRMDELREIFGDDLTSIDIVGESELTSFDRGITESVSLHRQILDSDQYLLLTFDMEEIYSIFYLQRNHTFSIVVVSFTAVCLTILTFIFFIVKRLRKLTKVIRKMSDGDYHIRASVSDNRFLEELNEMTTAVNRMAEDIDEHLQTIDMNYLEMVDVIINAVEINDYYTSKHNIEVGNYAVIIAKEINFQHMDDLVLAAKLHDIGKISIPGHILNKPGRLTKEEVDIIKTHPSEGYKIIEQIEYFEHIKLGVKHHHEHWDGTGYPDGLKGNEIPLIAQIIAVADVYDALTSDRSYRKAMTHEKAFQIIIEESGKLFNPLLVDVFIRKDEAFKAMLEDCSDRR